MITSSLVLLSVLAGSLALPAVEVPAGAIPLFKRNNIKRADGTVNATLLRNHLTRSLSKIQRGFNAFEKNTGAPHRLANGAQRGLTKRANEALTDFEEDLWFGSITVGTPAKTFTVDFDTGSSDTFLPSSSCDSTCAGHTLWNPAGSSTAVNTGAPYSLAFGDGSIVEGTVFMDTVTVAGLSATSQAVGASTTYSTGFEAAEFPPDGLVGLAFPQLAVFGDNDLFTTLVNEGKAAAQFGVKLADSGSELFLGGVNTNLFKGSFVNTPVVQDAFWEVALQAIGLNGATLASGSVAAIVDTGTTLLIGDSQDVLFVYENIPGAKDASSVLGDGFFTVPCDAIPTLSLTFGGTAFSISPETFNAGQLFEGGADCVGGLAGEDLGFWVIGDVFLRNVYTSFNKGANEVGFALLA